MANSPSSATRIDLDLDESQGVRNLGPAQYPGDDDDDNVYATYSRALMDERREAMESLFIIWTQNLLFLAGLQWWVYDRLTGTFREETGPKWKERPVRNMLVPYFKFVMAKLTKSRPRTKCIAATTDPEDIESAELGDDILRAKWHELRMTRMLRRIIAWVVPTGNAYVMPFWNTESGVLQPLMQDIDVIKHDAETHEAIGMEMAQCPCDENGDPIMTEDGHYDMEAQPHYVDIGELAYKVLSPFQVFFDMTAVDEEEVHDVIVLEALTLREIFRRWPETSDGVVAEDVSELDRYDNLLVGFSAGSDTHIAGGHYERNNYIDVPKAVVTHYFEEKSPKYPHGRHWVSTGTDHMLERPGALPDGIWPVVVPFGDIEVPGKLHREATMTAVVGLQREYNQVNGHIKEHHNLMLRGKWLVPLGSNIRRGHITQAPGEVIQHTPGMPPVMADLKALPQKMYDEREKILQDIQTITGVHQVSMGNPPPGVTSGRAFLTLQEADDSDIAPMVEMLEEGVADLGWLGLQIIQEFYDEERLVRVSGDDRRYRVRSFKGADLDGVVDVIPQVGSAFPWSQTAKQSMMIDLATQLPTLFQDPDTGLFDNERFRRMLPIGGEEAVGLDADVDINEALREEEDYEFWDGTADLPTVDPWQNHSSHLRSHSRVLKTAGFKKWEPLAAQAFILHWQRTADAVQQIRTEALLREMALNEKSTSASDSGSGGNAPSESSSETEPAEA